MKKSAIILFFVFSCILILSCSGSEDFSSKWTDEPIAFQGTSDQWAGKTTFFKDDNFMLGLQNDGSYLYLVLTTADKNNIMQILTRGLIIQFNKSGNKDQTFGIKYPLGARESGLMNMHRMQSDSSNNSPDWMSTLLDNAINSTRLEILGPDEGDEEKVEFGDAGGISAKLSRSSDVLIYELKIALRSGTDNKYSLGVSKTITPIGLGILTGSFGEKKENEKGREGNEFGRGNHGRGNRGNFNRGKGNMQMQAPIEKWFKVQLSSKSKK